MQMSVINHSKIADINGITPGKLGSIVTLGIVITLKGRLALSGCVAGLTERK